MPKEQINGREPDFSEEDMQRERSVPKKRGPEESPEVVQKCKIPLQHKGILTLVLKYCTVNAPSGPNHKTLRNYEK